MNPDEDKPLIPDHWAAVFAEENRKRLDVPTFFQEMDIEFDGDVHEFELEQGEPLVVGDQNQKDPLPEKQRVFATRLEELASTMDDVAESATAFGITTPTTDGKHLEDIQILVEKLRRKWST